jgi:hypothetical protein
VIESLTQFGVAGLMGLLWVWERSLSRRRERQLNEAHARLMHQQRELAVLIRLVRRNTQAMERFEQTNRQLITLLDRMHDEITHRAA